jgi:hypothetical protein
MLRYSQIQMVADRLSGRERGRGRPEVLDEPWRTVYERVQRVDDPALAERELWKATAGLEDRHGVVEAVLEQVPQAEDWRVYPSLEELARTLGPVEWLWPGWIPRGMLSLLGAAPGAGKSLVALDLARRLLAGEGFPDGAEMEFPAVSVLYVDAEAVPQIQNERAAAWGMDRSRLFLMLPKDPYGMIDFGEEEEQDRLVEMVYKLRPELVVVDSLSSISVRGENNVEDVRAVLGFLGAVAREFELGMLLIHHLRKRSFGGLRLPGPVGPDDFRGSSHIIAMARSVLALSVVQAGPEPDRNGPRRLEVIKTNLCKYPPALGVAFEEEGGAPWLRYGEATREYREPTKAEACAAWLVELLAAAGEPVRPKDVVEAAEETGFSQAVLYRARKGLEGTVVDTGKKFAPDNRWSLRSTASEAVAGE